LEKKSTLLDAMETMANENIDVLPVLSKDDNSICGILSYKDIIASYKFKFEENEHKQAHISLKRNSLKILLKGQKMVSAFKKINIKK
jgi:CIC family chloride channel protein